MKKSLFTSATALIAESAERWDLARQYLGRVVRVPVELLVKRGSVYWVQAGFSASSAKAFAWSGVGRVVRTILASGFSRVCVTL